MKPTVFNYQEYERVVEENKKLKAEVADLRIRIADGDKRDCKSCKHQKADGCSRWNCEYEPRMDGLISRQDAIEAVATVTMSIHLSNVLCDKLLALPSADRPTGWTTEQVAEMLANLLGDECACNFNGIDEWLPLACKYANTQCPDPKEKHGCWMQFLIQGGGTSE